MSRLFIFLFTTFLLTISAAAQDNRPPRQDNNDRNQGEQDGNRENNNQVSPIRRIENMQRPDNNGPQNPPPPGNGPEFRSIDGSGNNPIRPQMGAAFTQLLRLMPAAYTDGISEPSGSQRPNPRTVSNLVCAQPESKPNTQGVTDFLWQWGQFLDHDIDLTDGTEPPESFAVDIPAGDPHFDPRGTGAVTMPLNRSAFDESTGTDETNPRQQINQITTWIDASMVYGSDAERAAALRTNDGSGKLKTSEGDFMPFNTEGLPNAGGSGDNLFLGGDVRANEQLGLIVMHTLFVREHNRLAEQLAERNPNWNGERLYQEARKIVAALVQVITYREFLPALLGPDPLEPYAGYRAGVDASIANGFSTGAYRFGHSAVNAILLRLDRNGNEIEAGHLALREAFFAPHRLAEGGLEPILRGLAAQPCQEIDALIVDDLRNFLFGPPGSGGFDLATLNIQRGRDHGLTTFGQMRRSMGMRPITQFSDISSDPEMQQRLAAAYESVDQVDLWVGCLAEDSIAQSLLGPVASGVIKDQFRALRDGDRFWYARHFSGRQLREIENTTLADVIRRNTDIGNEIPDDVFHLR
ncbi:MAG: peroxidase family protein [Acidobacteriota bacterium]|nr:peroxidase family protein [Acidobacteriota bacterium]